MANMGQNHRRRGAGNAFHAMMLCHPISVIAQLFDMLRQIGSMSQRLCHAATLGHGDKIKKG